MSEFITIDGSNHEGGGQIIRNAISYSAVYGKNITVENIRKSRPQGGLGYQHLTCVDLLKSMCNADTTGAELRSENLEFMPKKRKGGTFDADCGTAGSLTLLTQATVVPAVLSNKNCEFKLRGGTDVSFSPTSDYMNLIVKPIYEQMGIEFELSIIRRGFYPKGNGLATLSVRHTDKIKPICLTDPGDTICKIDGFIYSAGLPDKVGMEMRDTAAKVLQSYFGKDVEIDLSLKLYDRNAAFGVGSGLTLRVVSDSGCVYGASRVGSRGESPSETGSLAANTLCQQVHSCIDEHIQDMLILPMTLASGKSTVLTSSLTSHTKSAIDVARLMTKSIITTTEMCCEDVKAKFGNAMKRASPGEMFTLIECSGNISE